MNREGLPYRIRRKLQVLAFHILPNDLLSKIYYRIVMKQPLNLKEPKSFNEKIQWLKLNYLPKQPLVAKCADKYRVHEFLEEKGFKDKTARLLGVWERAEDIDWDSLPDSFVLKCNHGCAYNIICTDKATFDRKEASKKLNRWLKEDFGAFNVELHYSNIKRHLIICEEFLGKALDDWKIYCFDGKPEYYYAGTSAFYRVEKLLGAFDMEHNLLPFLPNDSKTYVPERVPDCFEEMKNMAAELSRGFPVVRVDFFVWDNQFRFAEMTFTPAGGLSPILPESWERKLGDYISLEGLKPSNS